jgi:hypothetical protein
MLMLVVVSAGAQLTPPPITTKSNDNGGRPVSAAEAAHHVWIQDVRNDAAHSFRAKDYPIDSMHSVVAATGAHWLANLPKGSVRGIQLDPSGRVDIAAKQEPYARQQIAERLATPGLSFDDKAYTLMTAVDGFSDYYYPERLPEAEAYLAKLDAMGEAALNQRFRARLDLVDTYYLLGRSKDVLRHGLTALDMIPKMTFFDRCLMTSLSLPGCGSGDLYAATIDALTGQPGGGAKIEALNQRLKTAMKASPADVAFDTAYALRGEAYENAIKYMILGTSRLGTKAKPIISNYWFNRGPTRDSGVVLLDDGKVRVIEVAGYN